MKPGLMISGILLFIGAIIVNKATPSIMSQLDNIVTPLQGNVSCGLNKDTLIGVSQINDLSPVNQFFHQNICSTLSLTQTTLEFSMIVVGIIAILIVIYGGLTSVKNIKAKQTAKY